MRTLSCTGSVEVIPGARYPFKPQCICGWTTWGYATFDSAKILANAHENGERV